MSHVYIYLNRLIDIDEIDLELEAISGSALAALKLAIKKAGKKFTNLKNRF